MNINSQIRRFFALCLLLTMCPQPGLARQPLDKVVAIVNNDVISQSELNNYEKLLTSDLKQGSGLMLQRQVLNRMILDKIQVQLAEQSGIEVDSIMVSQTIQNIAKQQGESFEGLKNTIEARGIRFNDYRELIRSDLMIQHLQNREVNQDINISQNEIESYLSSPAGQDQSGTEYKLSHILLLTPESPTPEALKKAQQQAEDLVAKLKNGADFSKAAMTKSAGRQALKGGDLGWRTAGEIPTLFVAYTPNMKVGDVIGPIRSSSGFHIIKLQDKRTASEESRIETKVRMILIKPDANTSDSEAETILAALQQQINKGADFAKLAAKNSQDPRTSAKGGELGWVTANNVPNKFAQAMSKLRNNELSDPFRTDEGWCLIQVLDRRTQLTSNEAAWNKAREILTVRKSNEALEAWTKRIRDEAQVEIMLSDETEAKTT